MKKRFLLYNLLIMLVLLPSAFALYEEKIFDGNVQNEVPFVIDNKTYEAFFIRETNNTVIYYPDGVTDVIYFNNETCSEQWIYKSCISNVQYTKNGKSVPIDVHDYNIDITFDLEIYASYANLDVQRAIEKTKLFVGERTAITTILENLGELKADNITLREYFPEEFYIISVVGCNHRGNLIYWQGELESKKQKKCTYEIKALNEINYDSTLNVNYSFLERAVSKEDSQRINVINTPLKTEFSVNNLSLRPTEYANLSVGVVALDDIEIISFKVYVPDAFNIEAYSNELNLYKTNILRFSGKLNKGEKKDFFFNINTNLINNYSLVFEFIYKFNEFVRNQSFYIPVSVNSERFYLWSEQKDNRTLIKLSNPTDSPFYRININAFLNGQKIESFELEELKPWRYKEFFIDGTDEYSYDIRYRTQYGQYLSFKSDLSYSPYEGNATLSEQAEDITEIPVSLPTKQESDNPFSFNFEFLGKSKNLLIFILLFGLISVLFFKFILSGKEESSMDKEINDIKKQSRE